MGCSFLVVAAGRLICGAAVVMATATVHALVNRAR
jgi:uncharacterized membrane protein YadS